MQLIKSFGNNGSFTVGVESSRQRDVGHGFTYSTFGVAVLFYKPERRLSVSLWSIRWSKNICFFGPKKLSWEK